jgi:hypothetical protein
MPKYAASLTAIAQLNAAFITKHCGETGATPVMVTIAVPS